MKCRQMLHKPFAKCIVLGGVMWLAVMPPVPLLSSWLMVEDMSRADRQASSGYKLNVP